jgi:membrane protein insertase Oxa1/YidC/SpoIIIJ
VYELPLVEVIADFFNALKSATEGNGTFFYLEGWDFLVLDSYTFFLFLYSILRILHCRLETQRRQEIIIRQNEM